MCQPPDDSALKRQAAPALAWPSAHGMLGKTEASPAGACVWLFGHLASSCCTAARKGGWGCPEVHRPPGQRRLAVLCLLLLDHAVCPLSRLGVQSAQPGRGRTELGALGTGARKGGWGCPEVHRPPSQRRLAILCLLLLNHTGCPLSRLGVQSAQPGRGRTELGALGTGAREGGWGCPEVHRPPSQRRLAVLCLLLLNHTGCPLSRLGVQSAQPGRGRTELGALGTGAREGGWGCPEVHRPPSQRRLAVLCLLLLNHTGCPLSRLGVQSAQPGRGRSELGALGTATVLGWETQPEEKAAYWGFLLGAQCLLQLAFPQP